MTNEELISVIFVFSACAVNAETKDNFLWTRSIFEVVISEKMVFQFFNFERRNIINFQWGKWVRWSHLMANFMYLLWLDMLNSFFLHQPIKLSLLCEINCYIDNRIARDLKYFWWLTILLFLIPFMFLFCIIISSQLSS